MHKWHRGSSVVSSGRRVFRPNQRCDGCATRQFHVQAPLHQDDDGTSAPARPMPTSQRQRSQNAGRMIQGLRGAAPGGFGPSSSSRSLPLGPASNTSPQQPLVGRPLIRRVERDFPEDSRATSSPSSNTPAYVPRFQRMPSREPSGGDDNATIPSRTSQFGASRGRREVEEYNDDEEDEEEDDDDEEEDDPEKQLRETKAAIQANRQHFEWADAQIRGVPKVYEPPTHQVKDLITNRTSTFAGSAGVLSELDTAMANLSRREDISWGHDEPLARRLIAGKLVRFRDEEEKRRVVKLAEEFACKTANIMQDKKGHFVDKEDVGFVPVPKEYRKLLGNRAMAGHYDAVIGVEGTTPELRALSHLKTSLQLNPTYSQSQAKGFSEFFERMWPAQRTQAKR